MPTTSQEEAKTLFRIGAFIASVTALVQAVILLNNASYALSAFGWAFLIIYLSAAAIYISWPWISEHVDQFAHSGATRGTLLAFILWLTTEEHLHAAHEFKAPEGITAAVSLFTGTETAKGIATVFVVVAILVVVEVLHHIHAHGAMLVKTHYRQAHK